jgi:hypothetical protein
MVAVVCLMGLQGLLTWQACTSDELPAPTKPAYCDTISLTTYENGIRSVITNTCAYAGCHDGGTGIGPGDYTGYQGILPHLVNGSFQERVVNQQDDPVLGMPPDASVYAESRQDDLTEREFQVLQCWLLEGYPE